MVSTGTQENLSSRTSLVDTAAAAPVDSTATDSAAVAAPADSAAQAK